MGFFGGETGGGGGSVDPSTDLYIRTLTVSGGDDYSSSSTFQGPVEFVRSVTFDSDASFSVFQFINSGQGITFATPPYSGKLQLNKTDGIGGGPGDLELAHLIGHGDIQLVENGLGISLLSPSGNAFKITVDDTGLIISTPQ